MSIRDNVSSAIELEDRHRVRAVAAAILEHQGFKAAELLDLVIDEGAHTGYSVAKDRAERAVQLAACIVNYLRADLANDPRHELLQALTREFGQ
jgi:dihydroxyacetone kinase